MPDGPCVVDTSAWIEWLVRGPDDAWRRALAQDFPPRDQCVVPTLVQLELSKWLHRELDESRADEVLAYTLKCEVVVLDTRIALLAADLHRAHRLATADAIVYATALDRGAQLLTCDAHFEGLTGVVLHRKPG
jgi:predicted nucleic acid-binding protein